MNEVSTIRGVNPVPVAPASSKAATATQATTDTGDKVGNNLPLDASVPVPSTDNTSGKADSSGSPAEPVNIEDAIASMNDYVQTVQRDLQFTVDEELDKTVVKVLDSESGEVIRQIPEQTFLELARNMQANLETYGEYGDIRFIDAIS